jgi:TRAP-type mannitol/chloroaromatic compound transport system permease small subunit
MMPQNSDHMSGDSPVEKLVQFFGRISSWLCLVLVLLQFGIVVARYLFDTGSVMAQEALLYIFGTMFMLMLAGTLRANLHVRVDTLYNGFSSRRRRWVDAIGLVVFLGVFSAFLIYVSWGYVASSWAAREGSSEPLGLPGVYLFKTVIIVAFLLLVAQALVIVGRCLGRDTEEDV